MEILNRRTAVAWGRGRLGCIANATTHVKPGYKARAAPNLDIVTVHELLRVFERSLVVCAFQFCGADKMAVLANYVCAIAGHWLLLWRSQFSRE